MATLGEEKIANNKCDAQSMLDFHQLLSTHNYEVAVSLETKGVRTSSFEILYTGARSNLVKKNFVVAGWASSIQNVRTIRLWSAANAPMEIK